MFLSYIFYRTGGAGQNFAQGRQDIKICAPFLLSGGVGENFTQVLANWQIETVNLSFKVCRQRTRKKCRTILHHLLQYRRHMENIGRKRRHRNCDMFGS